MSVGAATLDAALRDYRRLRGVIPIGPLRSRREYRAALKTLDRIIARTGDDDAHPLADLAEAISVFIERYEHEHLVARAASPADVLRLLMDQHDLRQADLPEIGSQGVVSEILAGKRRLNARQVRQLARRFHVSPAVFLA